MALKQSNILSFGTTPVAIKIRPSLSKSKASANVNITQLWLKCETHTQVDLLVQNGPIWSRSYIDFSAWTYATLKYQGLLLDRIDRVAVVSQSEYLKFLAKM